MFEMIEIIENVDNLLENGDLAEAEELLFTVLDELTDEAGLDCDNGDYHGAVEKYRDIISLMQRYYGDSIDLDKIQQSIAEIQRLI